MIWKARLARVVRSPYAPPGQIIVMDPSKLPEAFDDQVKVLVLPPETSDEVLAQAEKMVEAHNSFERDMETLTRAIEGNGG